jgi:hypothetical protein
MSKEPSTSEIVMETVRAWTEVLARVAVAVETRDDE